MHRFNYPGRVPFRFIVLTEKNFSEIDIAHRHGYWSVFVFLKGSGTHLIDFDLVKIESNTIHFVLPGQIHALNGGKNFKGYAILFTEEFFLMREETKQLLMQLFAFMDAGQSAIMQIPPALNAYFEHLFSLFEIESAWANTSTSHSLEDLFAVLITKCSSILQPKQHKTAERDSMLYIQFRNAVEQNFRNVHTVSEYGKLLHVSPKALNATSHTFSGISALEFIHARLLIESKRQLSYTNKPVKQIAYELQFTDAAHFNKFFKLKTGLTPQEYKQQSNTSAIH